MATGARMFRFSTIKFTTFIHLLSFILIEISLGSHLPSLFKDFPPSVLQRHIEKSRHVPICVIFRKLGEGSLLEKHVYSLWKNSSQTSNYTKWQYGSFSPQKSSLPGEEMPNVLPSLQCYIGLGKAVPFKDKHQKKKIRQWFSYVSATYAQQIQEASSSLVQTAVQRPGLILLSFPGFHQHYQVEEMLAKIRAKWSSDVNVLISHEHSDDSRHLEEKYSVTEHPTVVVIENSRHTSEIPVVVHKFTNFDVNYDDINTYLAMKKIPAVSLNMNNFVKKTQDIGRYYQSILICFYASWAPRVESYLSSFQRTAEEFQELNSTLRFGVFDVSKSLDVINLYLDSSVGASFPFTVLFHPKRINGRPRSLLWSHLKEVFPTPLNVYKFLHKENEPLTSVSGEKIIYEPWGRSDPTQVSSLFEGPFGHMCSVIFHNATENNPKPFPPQYFRKKVTSWRIMMDKMQEVKLLTQEIKHKEKPVKKPPMKPWHRKFDTDIINKKLTKIGSLPVLTASSWSEVVERSHAAGHPLVSNNLKWSGEVTKVTLVIFIQADCSHCQNNIGTFQELEKASRYIDGASVYLMNCTTDRLTCRQHEVTGYPTVMAFRGLGWVEGQQCMSAKSAKQSQYVRVDYHGVLLVQDMMEWLSAVAVQAVDNLRFTLPSPKQMKGDVQLVGTLIPKTSSFLPFIPGRKWDYFYSYECFRLTCERLYGYAMCAVHYSNEIPEREFRDENQDMIVSKVRLMRRDGLEAVVAQIGTTFVNLLEEEAKSAMHSFHTPHRYNVRPGQHCEDDHSFCTDLIVDFTRDHGRLPVTHLTVEAFHTKSRYIPTKMPVLMALVHSENITEDSPFLKMLTNVAYDVYESVMVVTMNIDQRPWWAEQFVPAEHRPLGTDDRESSGLFVYPRFCVVYWHDHHHAAFYPSIATLRKLQNKPRKYTRKGVLNFLQGFLKDPAALMVSTAHF